MEFLRENRKGKKGKQNELGFKKMAAILSPLGSYGSVGGLKIGRAPEHKSNKRRCAIHERQGDQESPKVCTRLKSCEPLYMCPHAPFYRETKEHLHSENNLESEEYSYCEHVHKCLLHPVIYGANFIHLQACH
jgi:hypothetical protein